MQKTRRGGVIVRLMAAGLFTTALLTASHTQAQTTANGPYYATPSWDQTLPVATRFIILSNFNSEAVLDRETGLVWERSPQTAFETWSKARIICMNKNVGGRKGWRLPSIPELVSLIDPLVPPELGPSLPFGHPFIGVLSTIYWSATTDADVPTFVWLVSFYDGFVSSVEKTGGGQVWCVRGGNSAEVY